MERTTPLPEELHVWALRSVDEVPPISLSGNALHYLLAQWPKLIRYVEDGRIPVDNNATERAIRPCVIGRRNWLFADIQRGASASVDFAMLAVVVSGAGGLRAVSDARRFGCLVGHTQLPDLFIYERLELANVLRRQHR